jgi:hypothetical protein
MSQIKVDSIVPRGGLPAGANGGVIQIVQSVKTSVFSTQSTSWVDITGMTATITPQSASNKIMVSGNFVLGTTNGGYFQFRILRGSTAIDIGAADGNKTQATYSSFADSHGSQYNFSYTPMYLDSPNTTSATTYKCQFQVPHSSYGAVINRTWADDNSDYLSTYQSNFTLMEVSV